MMKKKRQQGDDEKKTGMKERERERERLSPPPSLANERSRRDPKVGVFLEKKNGRALAEKKFSRQGISRFEVP